MNAFAWGLLVPPLEARQLAAPPRAMAALWALADRIGVAPGIVVGHVQPEPLLPWSL